jgi:hypothetical protein
VVGGTGMLRVQQPYGAFSLYGAEVHHLFWSTNAILIQVNVAIGRSAEMAACEEDVFLGGLYHSGSVAEMRREWRYESR